MPLTREEILAIEDSDVEEFYILEWSGSVYLRNWSGRERDKFESEFSSAQANGKMVNIRATVAALSISDEKGARLFTEADILKLGSKCGAALDKIFTRACRKNHLLESDIEKLEGNLKGDRKGSSGFA